MAVTHPYDSSPMSGFKNPRCSKIHTIIILKNYVCGGGNHVCNSLYTVMCHYTVLCVIIYKYMSSTLKDNGEQFKELTEEFKK